MVSRPEIQVIGVGQDNLDPKIRELLRSYRFDRGLCANWHKGGGVYGPMGSVDSAHSRTVFF